MGSVEQSTNLIRISMPIVLNTANLNTYAKKLSFYDKNLIELRQINVLPTTASMSSVEIYSVTADNMDWTSNYYGITSFPYSVIVLPEVYDNIIQGFTQLNVISQTAVAPPVNAFSILNYDDKYMLNQFRNRTVRIARLFSSSTSITSSITSDIERSITADFIDYQSGIIVIFGSYALTATSLNYSSGIQVTDNQFICIAKSNEFNRTTNPSAYGSLTGNVFISDYDVPYITGIGIYDDDANLLAVAKFSQPIKKSKKIDIVFKIQIDM